MRALRNVLLVAALLGAAYFLFAPAPQAYTSAELVERAIAEKLAGWQDRRDRECRRRALAAAMVEADSLMLDYAREQKLMLDRPGRPIRPVEPPLERPSDTLELRPFLGRDDGGGTMDNGSGTMDDG